MAAQILLVPSGGTIDKVYGTGKRIRDLHIGKPAAPEILRKAGYFDFEVIAACRKDSLDLTERHRKKTEMICWKNAARRPTIITHGTDTMIETAEFLSEVALGFSSPIYLTGASQPACMKQTDAHFNVGLALGACLTGPKSGIFIAMNGIFPWRQCEKRDDGSFGLIKAA